MILIKLNKENQNADLIIYKQEKNQHINCILQKKIEKSFYG